MIEQNDLQRIQLEQCSWTLRVSWRKVWKIWKSELWKLFSVLSIQQ